MAEDAEDGGTAETRKSALATFLTGGGRYRPLEAEARRRRAGARAGDDWPFLRRPPPPAPEGADEQLRVGVCCSGGGIRSASFNLGALQALREHGLLSDPRTEHLAAVSGGAYMAISHAIVAGCSDPDEFSLGHPLYGRLSPEEDHFRNHSTYLAPDSRGVVWFLYNLLVGFALNALVVLAVLFPAARVTGWLSSGIQPGLRRRFTVEPSSPGFEVFWGTWWIWLGAAALGAAFVARAHTNARDRGEAWDGARRTRVAVGAVAATTIGFFAISCAWWVMHRERTPDVDANELIVRPWMVVAVGAPLGVGLVLILVMRLWDRYADPGQPRAGFIDFVRQWTYNLFRVGVVLLSLVFALPAVIVVLHHLRNLDVFEDVDLAGVPKLNIAAFLAAVGSFVAAVGAAYRFVRGKGRLLVPIAATLVGPALLGLVFATIANGAAASGVGREDPETLAVFWTAGAALVVVELGLTNTFWSMHPFYRHRLSSAYAVRRVGTEAEPVDYNRPIRFSGLARPDGPYVRLPELVVCCALNVSGDLVPPGRPAASFTFARDCSGSPLTGYVETAKLEDETGVRELTLPALMAISGAALSPLMGKKGYRGARVLFTLLNVRLGVWIPNPLAAHEWGRAAPTDPVRRAGRWLLAQWRRPGALHLLREAFGSARIGRRYVYVTDGGHWENLGLVELMRRGCTRIVCFDASGDALDTFDTIGEAMALARSELGIEIELEPRPLEPDRETGLSVASHVVAKYRFPGERTARGRLTYVKTNLTPMAPWDVRAYARGDRAFPTHSTLVQLFDDRRFEAYRALGEASARAALADPANGLP